MDRKYETGTERSGERRKIMLHPSYSDLMKVVNSEVEPGEAPVVNSRYSIVMATSKRARQITTDRTTPNLVLKVFRLAI